MQQVDLIGRKIFDLIINGGYWIILITGAVEVIKKSAKHDHEGIVKAIIYTGISYGGLKLLVIILDMIKSVFS